MGCAAVLLIPNNHDWGSVAFHEITTGAVQVDNRVAWRDSKKCRSATARACIFLRSERSYTPFLGGFICDSVTAVRDTGNECSFSPHVRDVRHQSERRQRYLYILTQPTKTGAVFASEMMQCNVFRFVEIYDTGSAWRPSCGCLHHFARTGLSALFGHTCTSEHPIDTGAVRVLLSPAPAGP